MANNEFRCLLAEKEFSEVKLREKTLPLERLPSGDVTIDVHYSSLNYKDALAATAIRELPSRCRMYRVLMRWVSCWKATRGSFRWASGR